MNFHLSRIHKFLTALMLLCFFSLILSVYAQEDLEVDNATVEMRARFEALSKDVSINLPPTLVLQEFIKIIAIETNTVFLYEEKNLRGQMSITAPPNLKVSAKDALYFFEKILQTQGLALVPRANSNVVEILPAAEARFLRLNISKEVPLDTDQEFVMRLISFKHADLKRIQATLQPIFSKAGAMLIYEPLEMLMVLDNAANVERIEEIIEMLDVPAPEGVGQEVTLFSPKHSDIKELHKTVTDLYANLQRSGKAITFKLVIEERMNALFIVANKPVTEELISFLEKIDVPVEGKQMTIQRLRYLKPQEVIGLLQTVFPKTASVQLVPFDPMNAVVILASAISTGSAVSLIEQLDVERERGVEITIHPVSFAEAGPLGQLLASIFTDQIVQGQDKGETAKSSPVKIIPETRLNALIIIADGFTTDRIIELAERLDIPQQAAGNVVYELVPLKFTRADTMSGLLTNVFSEIKVVEKEGENKSQTTNSFKIIPEPRLNALIVITDQKKLSQLKSLLGMLDVFQEEDRAQSNFRLYSLKHAVAKDMAPLLLELTGRISEIATQTEAKNKETADDQTSQAVEKIGEISITSDEATNSLLIFAPPETLPTLEEIISRLDVPRLQVYVEAMLMEITLTKSLDLGVNWRVAGEDDGRISTGGFPGTSPFNATTATAAGQNAAFGIVGGEIEFGGQQYFSFGAFIRATQQDQDVDILANPQIMMLNNVSSSINVTTNTPVSTRTVTNNNGVTTTETEFKDIGIKLTIKPQISGEDSIRLEIQQESSNIVTSGATSAQTAITTFKRELSTTVVTRDNEIVVLGGLINETRRNSANSVPGFRDLPLIGGLFASSSDTTDKTNLLLFIRPKIIRTQDDLRKVTRGAKSRYESSNTGDTAEQLMKEMNLD